MFARRLLLLVLSREGEGSWRDPPPEEEEVVVIDKCASSNTVASRCTAPSARTRS